MSILERIREALALALNAGQVPPFTLSFIRWGGATLIILPAIFAILQGEHTRKSASLLPADRGEITP